MALIYRTLKQSAKENQRNEEFSRIIKKKFKCDMEDLQVNSDDGVDIELYKLYIFIVKASCLSNVDHLTFKTSQEKFLRFIQLCEIKQNRTLISGIIPYICKIIEQLLQTLQLEELKIVYASCKSTFKLCNSKQIYCHSIRELLEFDLYERHNKLLQEHSFISLIKLLRMSQKYLICPEHLIDLSLNYMFDYLTEKNDPFNIKKSLGIEVNMDLPEANDILIMLEVIKIKNEDQKILYNKLKKVLLNEISSVLVPSPEPNQEYDFDLTNAIPIYVRQTNFYIISVYKVIHINSTLAVKVYESLRTNFNFKSCNKEIEIYEKLSNTIHSDFCCFVKFFGKKLIGKKCMFAVEYFEKKLDVEMAKDKTIFIQHADYYIYSLLNSFSIMEQHGIYHRDIKPQNILVDNNFRLKIIDFNVSSRKKEFIGIDITVDNKIKGTLKYMAPELLKAFLNGKTKTKHYKTKADVFSLGLIFLEMQTNIRDVKNFNQQENIENLEKYIKTIKFPWIRNLIENMLSFNYKNRPTFKECMNMLESSLTINN